jgi:hypothetical protein
MAWIGAQRLLNEVGPSALEMAPGIGFQAKAVSGGPITDHAGQGHNQGQQADADPDQ